MQPAKSIPQAAAPTAAIITTAVPINSTMCNRANVDETGITCDQPSRFVQTSGNRIWLT